MASFVIKSIFRARIKGNIARSVKVYIIWKVP